MDPKNPDTIIQHSIGDLVRVADLVITTSYLEGFGFAYLEPWILDRPVIGRSIPFITPDFQAEGMKLGHLYTVLLVDDKDFKEIGKEKHSETEALQMRLETILKLNDPHFANKAFERNETPIVATIRLFDQEKRKGIVKINKKVVESVYSQDVIGRKLYDVIVSN
jgi:glycosyltransferase involved in cell wall biosynthesis